MQRAHDEFYQCAICELYYAEEEWAEQCEAWCREHPSCNIEITKHAVELKGGEQ